MTTKRQKAEHLRRLGNSYSEISKKLSIPKSTLSSWFKNEPWSKKVYSKLRLQNYRDAQKRSIKLAKALRNHWASQKEEFQLQAKKEFPVLRSHPLFLPGVILYWCNGELSPSNSQVRFSNSDPNMMRFMFTFFSSVLSIPRTNIHTRLVLYPDLVESVQKKVWSKHLNIPIANIEKSIIIKHTGKKRFSSGSCIFLIYSRKLKERLMKWIELYQAHFNSEWKNVI